VELPRTFLRAAGVTATTQIARVEGRIEIFPINQLAQRNAVQDRRSMRI
jgi:hypothetical protein